MRKDGQHDGVEYDVDDIDDVDDGDDDGDGNDGDDDDDDDDNYANEGNTCMIFGQMWSRDVETQSQAITNQPKLYY